MSESMADEQDARLIYSLQCGLPLEQRPFAEIGRQVGLQEGEVLERVRGYFERGEARRLGAIFDIRRLGYASVLCAVAVPGDALEEAAGRVTPHPGVTHCYLRTPSPDLDPSPQRDSRGLMLPNLWFTLSALGERFDAELQAMRRRLAPLDLLVLPATRRFKVHVIFDPRRRKQAEGVASVQADGSWDGTVRRFSQREKGLIRGLQSNLPLGADLYEQAAERTGYEVKQMLEKLRRWKENGVLRRVALIMRHRKIGFTANGMCTWPVEGERVQSAGRRLALRQEITHCYERATPPGFPYNLYAMIHTGRWEDTRRLFDRISREVGLEEGLVFLSTREFKKTSLTPFAEND